MFLDVSQHRKRPSDIYIIWFHVPAGFAQTDDMKISTCRFLFLFFLCEAFLIKPTLSGLDIAGAGSVQCLG